VTKGKEEDERRIVARLIINDNNNNNNNNNNKQLEFFNAQSETPSTELWTKEQLQLHYSWQGSVRLRWQNKN